MDYNYNQNIIVVQVTTARHLPLKGSARALLWLQLTFYYYFYRNQYIDFDSTLFFEMDLSDSSGFNNLFSLLRILIIVLKLLIVNLL